MLWRTKYGERSKATDPVYHQYPAAEASKVLNFSAENDADCQQLYEA